MREKINLFRKSIRLVWQSAPGWAFANIVLSVLRSFMPLALVWLLKVLIDSITKATSTDSGIPFNNVLWMIIAVVIVYFLDEAASDFSNYVRKKQSLKLEVYMYGLLHSKAIKLDLINFERPEYFDCLTRASREAPWRPNSILNNLVAMLRGLLSLLLMAGLITTLHWTLAVLLLVANIPGIWLRLHYADILYNFQRQQTPEARKSAYFNWLLTGDRPSRELRLFKASALLIALLFIARQTIGGTLSLGQMAMFLLAFRQGMIYIKDLFGSLAGLYEDSLFIGDTFEFLNLKEKVIAKKPVVIPSPLKKNIVVKNLSFTYPGNNFKTINDISFEINKGEIIALVGPNGAGKSTFVRLLCRLYDPDSGTIKYDNSDIRHIDPEEYRKFFSVVFQDFMLYNLTAGENIHMGNIDERDLVERIKASASIVGVHELVTVLQMLPWPTG